ncbi:hypothetical protein BH11PAT4_BH11PAT4_8390 [soil metagenome]
MANEPWGANTVSKQSFDSLSTEFTGESPCNVEGLCMEWSSDSADGGQSAQLPQTGVDTSD